MRLDKISINKTFLLSGKDLKITDNIAIKHPSIGEILELGNGVHCDDVYWQYVNTLISDPYSYAVWLYDQGIDFEEVNPFQVFIMRWNETRKRYKSNTEMFNKLGIYPDDYYINPLSFFIGKRTYDIGKFSDGKQAIYDINDTSFIIDEDLFNIINSFVKLINGFTDNNHIKPKNKNAKIVLIEDMRSEQKRAMKKEKDNDSFDYIGDLLSGIMHGSLSGVTPFNFKELKIFNLTDGMKITQQKINYDHLMTGIYSGTIKGDNLSEKQTLWAKSS